MARAYGIEQQLGRVAAHAARRVEAAEHAVPVRCPGPTPATKPCHTPASKSSQRDLGLCAGAVEQAQQHAVGDVRGDGEVRAAVDRRGAERGAPARPGRVAQRLRRRGASSLASLAQHAGDLADGVHAVARAGRG